jgi:hypothetical protein
MKATTNSAALHGLLATALAPVALFYTAAPGWQDITLHAATAFAVGGCTLAWMSKGVVVRRIVWTLLLGLWVLLTVQVWSERRTDSLQQVLFIGLGLPRAFALWTSIALPIYLVVLLRVWRRRGVNRSAFALALCWLLIAGLNRRPATVAPDVSPWPLGSPWIGLLYLLVTMAVVVGVMYAGAKDGGIEVPRPGDQ